jgi:hypothetical protein
VNVFFDVDHTIIDADHRLRPGVREAFERLRADGHDVYLWSGIGARWEIVRTHGLEQTVRGCFEKPLYQPERMLDPLGITIHPDYVVDDHPHLVAVFGGTVVSRYSAESEGDQEMARVLVEIERAAASAERPVAMKTTPVP